MQYRMMKTGLIGLAFGLGFGHETGREAIRFDKTAQEAIKVCRQNTALAPTTDIYELREMGRAEARQTGSLIYGAPEMTVDMLPPDPGLAYNELYRERTLGRAEAWRTGNDSRAIPTRMADRGTFASLEAAPEIYAIRSMGRDEARVTGTDVCEETILQERFGLR
jgi:hypothetical protein